MRYGNEVAIDGLPFRVGDEGCSGDEGWLLQICASSQTFCLFLMFFNCVVTCIVLFVAYFH